MAVSFNQIPNILLTPGAFIEYDNSRAVRGLAALPNRVILIGSRLATGTADAATMKQILREGDGWAYFGLGSQLGAMCEAFKKASKFTEVWAIALDDAAGAVKATKTATFAGTATSAGVFYFLVGGVRVPVTVAIGDTDVDVAAALAAAVAANPKLQVTAAVGTSAGVDDHIATLTVKNAGAFGTALDVRHAYYSREDLEAPAGITVTIAAGVAGTLDPDVSDAIAAIGDEWFTAYAIGYNGDANVDAVEAELERRWGPTVMQDAIAFYGVAGTFADLTTAAADRNSQFSILLGLGQSPTPPWQIAAVAAAVSSNEGDPARPRQTLPMPNVLAPAREARFTLEERNLLLQAGVATFTVDTTGGVLVERFVTSYTENADGLADASYRDLEIMLTLSALRYTTRARIRQKYPRHKLADDGANYGPGQAVVTPSVLIGELTTLAEEWESRAWIESAEAFAETLHLERNADDRDRVDAILGPDLVNGFRVFAAQIQYQV